MEHTYALKDGDLIVTVTSQKEELTAIYGKAMNYLAGQVTVKGFRKGKAPLDMAAPLVNQQALDKRFTDKLINAAFTSYLRDAQILKELTTKVPQGTIPTIDLPTPNDGSKVVFVYPLKPQVQKLETYTKLKTEVKPPVIDEKAIADELQRLAKEQADLVPVETPIVEGHYVNCDFKGFIADIENPSLAEKAFEIVVGAKKFIPGFEEKLLGHKTGDELRIETIIPDNYPPEIAGQKAVFNVKINSVKKEEIPALDDELATVQSTYPQAKDLNDLKEKIKTALQERGERAYKDEKFAFVINKVIEKSAFTLDETKLKAALVDNQRQEDEKTLGQQGLDLLTYLRLVNMDEKQYETNVYNNKLMQLKAQAVEQAIYQDAKLPGPSEEELASVAKKNGLEELPTFRRNLHESYLKRNPQASPQEAAAFVDEQLAPLYEQVILDKVVDFILANND